MRGMIVAGGTLSKDYLISMYRELSPDFVIAADKGLDILTDVGISPSVILGDYDSSVSAHSEKIMEECYQQGAEILEYPAEKDFTDTEAALHEAVDRGCTEIYLLGATGGRLDHFLGNLNAMQYPTEQGIRCIIADEQNRIELLMPNVERCLEKDQCFGKYISFVPLGDQVSGLTLKGFRYPLEHAVLKKGTTLGISNEIKDETARVLFQEGILTMIQSKDK